MEAHQCDRVVPSLTHSRVYAIHGLNSDANTWTWTKDRPLGSKGFNWLDKLGNALKQRGGQDVATYVVGWNTKPLSSANMSRNITDTARPLANAIVGRRGESKVRGQGSAYDSSGGF